MTGNFCSLNEILRFGPINKVKADFHNFWKERDKLNRMVSAVKNKWLSDWTALKNKAFWLIKMDSHQAIKVKKINCNLIISTIRILHSNPDPRKIPINKSWENLMMILINFKKNSKISNKKSKIFAKKIRNLITIEIKSL